MGAGAACLIGPALATSFVTKDGGTSSTGPEGATDAATATFSGAAFSGTGSTLFFFRVTRFHKQPQSYTGAGGASGMEGLASAGFAAIAAVTASTT